MNTTRALLIVWLVAVCPQAAQWTEEGDIRWTKLRQFTGTHAGFQLLGVAETGVNFTNVVSELAIAQNRVVEIGAGVALGDYDNDGLVDIFACGIESSSTLFRNLGNWKFRDETVAAGLPKNFTNVRGAVFADLDGDGKTDLLVATVREGVRCFLNSGGKFVEVTDQCGLRRPSGATTLALADIDGNGSLDLYVTNYRTNDIRDVGRLAIKSIGGKPVIPPELKSRFVVRHGDVVECGEPDQLYLNDGRGHFTAVSWPSGAFLDADGKALIESPLDWGLTATFRDVNGDGAPDLYVCNDYWTPDRLWINDGKGHFRGAPPFALRKTPFSSMGVDFADLNRDGRLDFFVVEMLAKDPRVRKRQMSAEKLPFPPIGINADVGQVFQNTLFLNRGDGTFAEIAHFAGLEATDWSWSPLFIDVDLDGDEDLLISTGHFHDVQDLDADRAIRARQHSWRAYTNEVVRQQAFTQELLENYRLYPPLKLPVRAFRNGGDLRFKDVGVNWGFTNAAIHHGMAFADLDGDGDLDLVVNCLNSALEIYRNDAEAPRIAVRLKGVIPNREAIGARIVFKSAAGSQQKEIVSGGRYLSGCEALAIFAFQPAASLEVTWRSGKKSFLKALEPNRLYEISEPLHESSVPQLMARRTEPLFEDVSDRLNHIHRQLALDDYQSQPTLPFKLSQRGPACGWADVNNDGIEDFVVSSNASGEPSIFYSNGQGTFTRATNALAALPSSFWPVSSNAACFAIGCFDPPAGLAVFVAGEVSPGRYPLAAPSRLFRIAHDELKADEPNTAALASVGIVNGAIWSDLDADGLSELILACEWGPIRVFKNRAGSLVEITKDLGLAEMTGLWRGVATADFDNDGHLDIVAANWGLNSPWRATPEHPFTAFYGEFTQPGRIEFIETEWDAIAGAPTARRPLATLASAMPFLFEQFASFKQFAAAPIAQLLGPRQAVAKQVSAKTLASTLFLNRAGKFMPIDLPTEAQLAPAFSVNAADFDGDCNIDIFLSQNLTSMHPDYAPQDSGRGILLLNNGHADFNALPADESGLKIYGEQRAAAVCDFDGDGRPDLAVTQNGAQTKLYRNACGKPGVRIKLTGPPANPLAFGAQIWFENNSIKTPIQEIQAGSGYLTRDSAVKILQASPGDSLHVRWPGGKLSSTTISSSANEITIRLPE